MELDTMFNITEKWWYRILSWAKLAYEEDKNEISGLATAVPNNKGHYWIENVEIMKQENSGSNTELDGDAVAAYKMKYGMKYNNPNMKFVWWHSHHTMDAFWSGTDLTEIDAWKNNSFSLALVVNLKEEYKFRVSVWKAGNLDLSQHYDIPLNICRDNGVFITNKMKKDYKELCEEKHSYLGYGTTYKNGKVISNQGHLFGSNKPKETKQSIYNDAINAIDKVNAKFIADEITLKKWTKTMRELASKYSSNDYDISFPMGKKQDILDIIVCSEAVHFIDFRTSQIEEFYTMDVMGWN